MITGVAVALEAAPVTAGPAVDALGDGAVTVDDLVSDDDERTRGVPRHGARRCCGRGDVCCYAPSPTSHPPCSSCSTLPRASAATVERRRSMEERRWSGQRLPAGRHRTAHLRGTRRRFRRHPDPRRRAARLPPTTKGCARLRGHHLARRRNSRPAMFLLANVWLGLRNGGYDQRHHRHGAAYRDVRPTPASCAS